MAIQFVCLEREVLESKRLSVYHLQSAPESSFVIEGDSMATVSAIESGATRPLILPLPEIEIGSIAQLLCGGDQIQSFDSKTVYHLSRDLLVEAMIDFAKLTREIFIGYAMVHHFSIAITDANDQGPDEILREFSDLDELFLQTDAAEPKAMDWLSNYHWPVLCDLKDFVNNALQNELEVVRLNAG